MSQQSDSSGSSAQGFLTSKDKKWLSGQQVGSKSDQKRRCQRRIAQAADDIGTIIAESSEGPSNLNGVGELFDASEDEVGMSNEEIARDLIALAFIITNDTVDYESIAEEIEIHPRQSDQSPDNAGQLAGGGIGGEFSTVEDILSFRRALRGGIKAGKDYFDDDVPHRVLIDSSTKLYKEPTRERIESDGFDEGFSTEDWKDAEADRLEAASPYEYDTDNIDREDALDRMIAEIEVRIANYQRLLRGDPNVEVRRHDY